MRLVLSSGLGAEVSRRADAASRYGSLIGAYVALALRERKFSWVFDSEDDAVITEFKSIVWWVAFTADTLTGSTVAAARRLVQKLNAEQPS
jgi:hypothetical protein